ncbi:MAG TPA: amidase [Solirubrobacteraceae bacterium]|nr:amidase [Solirubrobacteraceae bacterium]
MSDFAFLDATAQAELVRTGEVSPSELVDSAIERIEALNPEINAVITPLFEKARDAAAGVLPDGPLRGVPMLLKDLACHSAGDPMYEGMKFLRDARWVEEEDTVLAARFRRAGFVFCGKTNTPELGILSTTEPAIFGPSRNPWSTGHSTGGSSGGSAAAVAAGMVPLAHANDGGGSIRIPASACGLVGLKPSRGRTPLGPDVGDIMTGLVSEHVVTRTVRDCAAVLDAVHGHAPGDPYVAPDPARPFSEEVGADVGRLRIGIRTAPPGRQCPLDPECEAAAVEAGRLLESLGHHVEPVELPFLDADDLIANFLVRWTGGIAWNIAYWERKTGRTCTADDVEPATWALAEIGRTHSAADYLSAVERHQVLGVQLERWYTGGFDLLLTPTMAVPPPPLGSFEHGPDEPLKPIMVATPMAIFTSGLNMTGQPAISLPLHWNDDGLPIGVQLAAPYGREDVLLRVAAQVEEARPWADRRPPVFAGAAA